MTMLLGDHAQKALWQPVEFKMAKLVGFGERGRLWHICRQQVFTRVGLVAPLVRGFKSRVNKEINA